MLHLILITCLFCANNKGQLVAAPEVLVADQDPRGQGSGQVAGAGMSVKLLIDNPADTQRRFRVQVFLTLWYLLCYFQQNPNTADPISALPGEETSRISHISAALSPWQVAGRTHPSWDPWATTVLGAEQAPRKAGWFPTSGGVE